MSEQWLYTIAFFAWLIGATCFVLGLHMMNSPATARKGNQLSAGGMTVAVLTTLIYLALIPHGLSITAWAIIIVGFAIGGGAGFHVKYKGYTFESEIEKYTVTVNADGEKIRIPIESSKIINNVTIQS